MTPRPPAWSREEVELIVADYLAMLICELRGDPYNKAAHRRALQSHLDNRSEGSIEMKHMNISAVLLELGHPCIDGYKPAWNYQRSLLPEVVVGQISSNKELQVWFGKNVVDTEITVPEVEDILAVLVEAPPREERYPRAANETPERYFSPGKVDYLARDAANAQLGLHGEKFVVRYEKARLLAADRGALADRVEHTSQVVGDGLGFDILSFDADGRDRLIEVKTTRYGRYTPFYVSPTELRVSQERAAQYHLYRVFRFARNPEFFVVDGRLDGSFSLMPSAYLAFG